MKAKRDRMVTLIVWNNRRVRVQMVKAKGWIDSLDLIRDQLHHKAFDPRWQMIPGRLKIEMEENR